MPTWIRGLGACSAWVPNKSRPIMSSIRALFTIPGAIIKDFLFSVCKQAAYKWVYKHSPRYAWKQGFFGFSGFFLLHLALPDNT
jgi:hypothetical protein